MPHVSPGQWRIVKRARLAYVFDFGAPSRIRTCAHGSGVHSYAWLLPEETRYGRLPWGAYGTREIVLLQLSLCRRCAHDPEGHMLRQRAPGGGEHPA